MKLTPEQITQIIEGLENRKTKLVATHLITGNVTNVISKRVDGSYKNKVTFSKTLRDGETRIIFKPFLTDKLKTEEIRHSFELITTNKDKSETIIEI